MEGEDKRILHVYYSPKVAGTYAIFVRWSGEHVPGSPFHVVISEPTGQALSSNILEVDTSTDLEVNELADLDEDEDDDDDDDDGGDYGEDRVTSIPSFSDEGKQENRRMVKSASVTNAMSRGPVSLMHKSSSASAFSSSSGMLCKATVLHYPPLLIRQNCCMHLCAD